MTKKIENRGGARPNSGPKRKVRTYSDKTIARYERAAKELAKKQGCTLEYALLSMVYEKDIQDTVKASIMKQYNDVMVTKRVESVSETHNYDHQGPAIGLPEMREDPALKILKGGKD